MNNWTVDVWKNLFRCQSVWIFSSDWWCDPPLPCNTAVLYSGRVLHLALAALWRASKRLRALHRGAARRSTIIGLIRPAYWAVALLIIRSTVIIWSALTYPTSVSPIPFHLDSLYTQVVNFRVDLKVHPNSQFLISKLCFGKILIRFWIINCAFYDFVFSPINIGLI